MNKKLLLVPVAAMLMGTATFLTACDNGPKISIYVGNEPGVVDFYQKECNAFLEAEKEKGNEIPYSIKVSGVDMGSISGPILKDAKAHADIYSVAHDNVAKLATSACARPFTDEDLLAQVNSDNGEAFINVCKATVNNKEYTFAAPYISQALFLMYDKHYVSDEQAKTFEGLKDAAVAASAALGKSVKAVQTVGTDGYNFSFTILAREEATGTSTLKIYDDLTIYDGHTYLQGDDEVAFVKWINSYRQDPNGFTFPSDAGWTLGIQNHLVLSTIGGAWHVNAFVNAVGKEYAGIAMIPTFTLTSDTAFQTATAGSIYRGGTFSDVKVMMMNSKADSEKVPYMQRIIKHLTSREVQRKAFINASVIPAYSDFSSEMDTIAAENPDIDASALAVAAAQSGMSKYAIPQPFIGTRLNNFYYQAGAPAAYQALVDKSGITDREIQEGLYKVQYIWQNGSDAPEVPEVLPVEDVCIFDNE